MNYLRRERICEMLRLGTRQSYRLVGSSYGERISSDDVIDLINRSRRAIHDPLNCIPCDLMTPEETAERFAASDITVRELRAWVKRVRNIPPHFRFNKQTFRFSASRLEKWLAGRSRVRRRS